ncbi:putative nonsense-mediated mRNA decay protein Upf3 [Aspergillus homomorphus CBS 101889]|uniref:RRM domain-containing protein n=1 Tax=Aspergillus homomorphus (strain CBS 101889) TaxID=1450537 RepID=A0A395HZ29_ASPHC|nr:hypothetical protein BO97DRAFT_367811 [Aspergillus homomorphus CBS 101889]RAL12947.1 hypothetical protein BO97DRAFT_367811 [Aspergillus homomorphus CBS 101889]
MTQTLANKSTGGVLQIPVAATQKNPSATPKKAPKPPAPRLKLIIRRLPPGLTQAEFETALGPEWKTGAGKVDWFLYKPGKVSKDPAKPSRPSRAYVHVVSNDHTIPLSTQVRQTSFQDARNTSNDPVLLGPPSVEFAPFAKIPGSRSRKDARQGTIDQDPDFIAFLESLTQPITKPAAIESAADAEDKKGSVMITPLVQYIKEKKANKAKESSKSSRHKSDKEPRSEKVQAKKLLQRPDKEATQSAAAEKPERKSRSDRAAKEAVKAANKQAASVASKQAAKSATSKDSPKDAPQPSTERKRERGNISAAAKILQRDLGLAPSGGRRRGGKGTAADSDASKNEQTNAAPSEPPKKETSNRSSKNANSSQTSKGRERGSAQPQPNEPSEAGTPPVSTTPKPSKSAKGKQASASPAAAPTQAFLKHANPSQGVTEPLLETAFAPFGKVLKVEIDKKKGFGYVDFAEPDGLQKAIAASPVTVAQSQVVVLERKANPGGEKGRGKGRGESQQSPAGGNANNNNRGEKATEGGRSGGNSSRGPRGGRGSKGKGGSKSNSGGNANANAGNNSENKGSADGK